MDNIEACYERTVDAVYRTCRIYFKGNTADIEDAVQTTYLNLIKAKPKFENESHEKAWLVVTASNVCKNMLKSFWRKNRVDMEELPEISTNDTFDNEELLLLLRKMPEKQSISLYLFYYEGYSCSEIARALGKKEATVWGYLHEGRKKLKKHLEGDESE